MKMLVWYTRFCDAYGWYRGSIPGLAASTTDNRFVLGRKFALDEGIIVWAVIPPWEPELRARLLDGIGREKKRWDGKYACVNPSVEEQGIEEAKRHELEHLRNEHREQQKCHEEKGFAQKWAVLRTRRVLDEVRIEEGSQELWSNVGSVSDAESRSKDIGSEPSEQKKKTPSKPCVVQ